MSALMGSGEVRAYSEMGSSPLSLDMSMSYLLPFVKTNVGELDVELKMMLMLPGLRIGKKQLVYAL